MKKLILGILVVGAVVAGVYLLRGTAAAKQPQWEVVKVERTTLADMVTATGTVEPVTKVDVGTQVSGIIDKIYVDYNSVVKKGQLIAEMDKVTLQAELASQEAQLANSKAEYDYQQKNYSRSKVLYEKKLISDSDYEVAVYNYEKAKSAYEKAQADIIKVRRNLGYAVITSPIDGVVISREVEEGQTVAAGFETPTLFTIAKDLTEMQVVADVDEADIGQVKEGQRVTFMVDAYPDDVFEGSITQVRLEATTTSNVVTYEVVINAPNPELKLKPGLTANVTIYTLEKDHVLALPAKAFHFDPGEGIKGKTVSVAAGERKNASTRMVWVKDGEILKQVPVTIGITNGSQTEILQGLEEGEEVVTGVVVDRITGAIGEAGESSPFMPKPPKRK